MSDSFIKTHWSCFKYNGLLHGLNAYNIPRKERQVVNFWVTDEIAASKILFGKDLEYLALV